jgi:hypothetical protein
MEEFGPIYNPERFTPWQWLLQFFRTTPGWWNKPWAMLGRNH